MKATVADRLIDDGTSSTINFNITNVHYGTFIMGASVNNIIDTDNADVFGLIAHRLINDEHNLRICLRIDQQDRKFAIIVSYESSSRHHDSSTDIAFEWTFGA